jgi:phosphatidylethanolamine/phosphatidyl-N-methylethanolamine N-methyltransferase
MADKKFSRSDFIAYVQKNPSFISELMTLVSCYDLHRVKRFFAELDLKVPYVGIPKNEGYLKNKIEIDKIVTMPGAYIVNPGVLDQDYMDDAHSLKVYSETVDKFDDVVTNYFPPVPRAEAISLLEIRPSDKILEVGVGPGSSFEHYPRFGNILAIDFAPNSIEAANNKIERLGLKNIRAEVANIHSTPFADDEFDKVIFIGSLCVVRNPFRAMKEVIRISKHGSRIVLYEPCIPPIEEIAVLLFLLQPIARVLGGVWYKDFPPYTVPYNSYLDLFGIIKTLGFEIENHKVFDPPFNIINLITCRNNK